MSEKNVKDTSVKKQTNETSTNEVNTAPKNFSFNISAGEMNFTFTGPEGASIGTIYDVVHRLLLEVTKIAQARADAVAPKESVEKESVEQEKKDDTKKQ